MNAKKLIYKIYCKFIATGLIIEAGAVSLSSLQGRHISIMESTSIDY